MQRVTLKVVLILDYPRSSNVIFIVAAIGSFWRHRNRRRRVAHRHPGPHAGLLNHTVRAATLADAPAIADLAARTFPLACPPEVTAEQAAAFVATNLSESALRAYLCADDADIYVATDRGSLVGYALLTHADTPPYPGIIAAFGDVPATELSKLYLDPLAHGAGIATALMQAVLSRATQRGSRIIWLGVNDQNARARAFYEKSGFQQVSSREFAVAQHVFVDPIYATWVAG